MERRYKGSLDSDADKFIMRSVEGALRMRTLIHDLLSYSRVGTHGKPIEPTNCEALLDYALTNLKVAIEENGAVVTSDPLPTMTCDSTQLVQLFQNLISNAIKFRNNDEPPRVHISAKPIPDSNPEMRNSHSALQNGRFAIPAPQPPSLQTMAGGGNPCPVKPEACFTERKSKIEKGWLFSVQDNGIGIEPQYADRIFGIFQRLHSRSEYAGTGIGLAVCKKIVERHGGHIRVVSEPGKGSTFCFTMLDRT